MPNYAKLRENLEAEGFTVSYFETSEEALIYLDAAIDGKTIGSGGSVTLRQLGLLERLAAHNKIIPHAPDRDGEAMTADVYLSSLNGMAETGELINIDGCGNRISSGLFGHKKVYFIVGRNKIAPDYDAALWRARNIAGPKNAQRLGKKTPCAVKGDRCYNCKSPDRICRALTVYWKKPTSMEFEIILINEDLGY